MSPGGHWDLGLGERVLCHLPLYGSWKGLWVCGSEVDP